MQGGILGAIEILGIINTGKTDKDTHVLVKQIIDAMENKKRKEWPSKDLRACVNQMDKLQRKLFLETLKDMDDALTDALGK